MAKKRRLEVDTGRGHIRHPQPFVPSQRRPTGGEFTEAIPSSKIQRISQYIKQLGLVVSVPDRTPHRFQEYSAIRGLPINETIWADSDYKADMESHLRGVDPVYSEDCDIITAQNLRTRAIRTVDAYIKAQRSKSTGGTISTARASSARGYWGFDEQPDPYPYAGRLSDDDIIAAIGENIAAEWVRYRVSEIFPVRRLITDFDWSGENPDFADVEFEFSHTNESGRLVRSMARIKPRTDFMIREAFLCGPTDLASPVLFLPSLNDIENGGEDWFFCDEVIAKPTWLFPVRYRTCALPLEVLYDLDNEAFIHRCSAGSQPWIEVESFFVDHEIEQGYFICSSGVDIVFDDDHRGYWGDLTDLTPATRLLRMSALRLLNARNQPVDAVEIVEPLIVALSPYLAAHAEFEVFCLKRELPSEQATEMVTNCFIWIYRAPYTYRVAQGPDEGPVRNLVRRLVLDLPTCRPDQLLPAERYIRSAETPADETFHEDVYKVTRPVVEAEYLPWTGEMEVAPSERSRITKKQAFEAALNESADAAFGAEFYKPWARIGRFLALAASIANVGKISPGIYSGGVARVASGRFEADFGDGKKLLVSSPYSAARALIEYLLKNSKDTSRRLWSDLLVEGRPVVPTPTREEPQIAYQAFIILPHWHIRSLEANSLIQLLRLYEDSGGDFAGVDEFYSNNKNDYARCTPGLIRYRIAKKTSPISIGHSIYRNIGSDLMLDFAYGDAELEAALTPTVAYRPEPGWCPIVGDYAKKTVQIDPDAIWVYRTLNYNPDILSYWESLNESGGDVVRYAAQYNDPNRTPTTYDRSLALEVEPDISPEQERQRRIEQRIAEKQEIAERMAMLRGEKVAAPTPPRHAEEFEARKRADLLAAGAPEWMAHAIARASRYGEYGRISPPVLVPMPTTPQFGGYNSASAWANSSMPNTVYSLPENGTILPSASLKGTTRITQQFVIRQLKSVNLWMSPIVFADQPAQHAILSRPDSWFSALSDGSFVTPGTRFLERFTSLMYVACGDEVFRRVASVAFATSEERREYAGREWLVILPSVLTPLSGPEYFVLAFLSAFARWIGYEIKNAGDALSLAELEELQDRVDAAKLLAFIGEDLRYRGTTTGADYAAAERVWIVGRKLGASESVVAVAKDIVSLYDTLRLATGDVMLYHFIADDSEDGAQSRAHTAPPLFGLVFTYTESLNHYDPEVSRSRDVTQEIFEVVTLSRRLVEANGISESESSLQFKKAFANYTLWASLCICGHMAPTESQLGLLAVTIDEHQIRRNQLAASRKTQEAAASHLSDAFKIFKSENKNKGIYKEFLAARSELEATLDAIIPAPTAPAGG